MVKSFTLFFIHIFLIAPLLFAQNINVSASTDTSDYLVGDYIYYSIKVEHDEDIRITPPTLIDKLAPLEIIKVLPVTFENKNVQHFNYIVSGYDSARIVIPQISIVYYAAGSSEPRTINTNEVSIFIHTLQVNPEEDIADVKEPLRIPLNWWLIFIIAVIILVIALLGYFLYKKFKKPKEDVRIIKRTPAVPDYVYAFKELDILKSKKLWQQGKVKDYHSELTEIIRKYFEKRYNFSSLEMTTAQQIIVLNRVMDNQKLIDLTGNFLSNADLVKFAKFIPLPSVNEEMMQQAYEIIEKTKREDEQTRVGYVQ